MSERNEWIFFWNENESFTIFYNEDKMIPNEWKLVKKGKFFLEFNIISPFPFHKRESQTKIEKKSSLFLSVDLLLLNYPVCQGLWSS